MRRTIRIKAKAKINLFLEVTRRRPDGYHDLATLFARVGLGDDLALRRGAPGIKLEVKDPPPGLKPEDNIVHKAAVKFFAAFGIAPDVELALCKRVPVGAGLGGGSADAAAALLGLARLYRLPAGAYGRLMKIAASIGSDVPFFMLDVPMAEGRGRGEKLKALKPAGRLPHLVLVYPGVPVYTKDVYCALELGAPAEILRRKAAMRRLCGLLRGGRFTKENAPLLFNRLEAPVLPRHKAVRQAKEKLLALGADAVMMSGSGATVFALCWSAAKARRVAAAAGRVRGYTCFLTKFC
jgi:4-diphosphocytidyl-2-C-methyl-D-erythritol kinase